MINVGASSDDFFLFGKGFYNVEVESSEEKLVYKFINLSVSETHGIKVDAIIVADFALTYLFVPFR